MVEMMMKIMIMSPNLPASLADLTVGALPACPDDRVNGDGWIKARAVVVLSTTSAE